MSELLPSRQNEGYEACDDESGGLLQRTHFSDALLDYSACADGSAVQKAWVDRTGRKDHQNGTENFAVP